MNSIPNFIGDVSCSLKDISNIFLYFLEENLYSDVSFSVKCGDGNIDFSAHKLLLSMWSPLLAEMCCNQTNDGHILIEDVAPTIFDAMLKFMYGSDLERKMKDIAFVLKLYKAADTYGIEALRNKCRDVLISSTPDKNNVFQLLDAGKLFNLKTLEQRCYKILQSKTAEVLAAQELCNITPSMLTTVLGMSRVSFTSEYELISWVLAWVKNELLKDYYHKSFKEIITDYLPFLDFLSLTAEEFAKLYQNRKEDLMNEKDGFSIFMNIAVPGSYPLPPWCSSASKRQYRWQSSRSMDSFEQNLESLN